jgi:hypothetical protein
MCVVPLENVPNTCLFFSTLAKSNVTESQTREVRR